MVNWLVQYLLLFSRRFGLRREGQKCMHQTLCSRHVALSLKSISNPTGSAARIKHHAAGRTTRVHVLYQFQRCNLHRARSAWVQPQSAACHYGCSMPLVLSEHTWSACYSSNQDLLAGQLAVMQAQIRSGNACAAHAQHSAGLLADAQDCNILALHTMDLLANARGRCALSHNWQPHQPHR